MRNLSNTFLISFWFFFFCVFVLVVFVSFPLYFIKDYYFSGNIILDYLILRFCCMTMQKSHKQFDILVASFCSFLSYQIVIDFDNQLMYSNKYFPPMHLSWMLFFFNTLILRKFFNCQGHCSLYICMHIKS